jgi:hypothetical protein
METFWHLFWILLAFLALRGMIAVVTDRLAFHRAVKERGTEDLVSYFCGSPQCGQRHWTARSEWERL